MQLMNGAAAVRINAIWFDYFVLNLNEEENEMNRKRGWYWYILLDNCFFAGHTDSIGSERGWIDGKCYRCTKTFINVTKDRLFERGI